MQENTTTTATPILEKFREAARRAHYGTSIVPDQRADQYVKSYSEQLAADMREVEELGGDPEDYRTRYEAKFSAWLSAKSRCLSSMITGPSGFPTRRAEKANRSERNRSEEFSQFREKYMARLRRNQRRAERAQVDPVAEMRANIEKAEARQTLMIEANKIIRKKGIAQEEKILGLQKLGLSEAVARELFVPDFANRIGFADYQLINNGANIRRMKERLAELEKKAAAETKEQERPDGIRIVENAEADRLQIFFPGKPEQAMIQNLKSHGFKWSPSNGCWQRQLTSNARFALKYYILNEK